MIWCATSLGLVHFATRALVLEEEGGELRYLWWSDGFGFGLEFWYIFGDHDSLALWYLGGVSIYLMNLATLWSLI